MMAISERLIIRQGDTNLLAPEEFYKSIPEEYFSPHPFYIYGDKIDHKIDWSGNFNTLNNKSVRIEFKMKKTQLFGFDLNN